MLVSKEVRKIPNLDYCSWIFGNNDYDPDKAIYIDAHDPSLSLSYRQCRSIVRRLVAGLRARGVKPGDAVCLHSYNHIYYGLIYLAIVGAGGTFVGTNPAWTSGELGRFFATAGVRFVISEPDLFTSITPASVACNIPQNNIFAFSLPGNATPCGQESWEVLLEHGEEDWITFDDEARSRSTPAALMSTSGTTGFPKAAIISHYSHVSQNVMIEDKADKPYEVRRLCCLPPFHAFAAPTNTSAPLREGIPTYIMRRFDLEGYLRYIDKYRISETHMVNPIALSILQQPTDKHRLLDSLRAIWIGGAPLNSDTEKNLLSALNREARICPVYGMTECGWITTLFHPEKDDTAAAGRVLPGVEARIIDGHGVEAEEGEIQIRGPSIMSGYLNNPEATNQTIVDGWLNTGDIGYQKDGKLYITDRSKDIIKVRGWQVSPTELEAALLLHSMIVDCAVIGVEFEDQGELPRAYVVTRGEVSDADINSWMAAHLAKYKQLAGGIRRVNGIPRGGAGKILKRLLHEQARKEIAEGDSYSARSNGLGSHGQAMTTSSSIPSATVENAVVYT